MKNNSSGWIVFALFALIPGTLILGGMIFALFAATRTSTHRISTEDPEIRSGKSHGLSIQFDSDKTAAPTGDTDPSKTIATSSTQETKSKGSQNRGKAKKSDKTDQSENPDHSKKLDDSNKAKEGDDNKQTISKEGDDDADKNTSKDSSKDTKGAPLETTTFDIPDWYLNDRAADHQNVFLIETGLDSPENVNATIERESLSVVNHYVRTKFGNSCADRVKVDLEYVSDNLIHRIHIRLLKKEEAKKLLGENPTTNDLECVFGYAELEFNEEFDSYVMTKWQRQKQSSRLGQIFLVAGSVFLLLILAFSFFSTDRATRGMYTVRLQLGSLLLVALAALIIWAVAMRIDWI